jgi:hypothetical protein
MRRADLLERELADLEAARDAWRAALDLDPTERHALARLVAIQRQLEYFDELCTTLERWADVSDDPAETVAVLLHLAAMQREQERWDDERRS